MDTGLDAVKSSPKKVVHKLGKFWGNCNCKTVDTVTKSNDDKIVKPDENSRNVEEIIITVEKWDETLNRLRNLL